MSIYYLKKDIEDIVTKLICIYKYIEKHFYSELISKQYDVYKLSKRIDMPF